MKVLHRYKLAITLVGILLLAAFLRLYRIADYMTFLGDEGRDVLVAQGILQGNLVFLGPRASAGDFFLGPIYYYMMAPFLWLFRGDPVGPAVMIALFGVATVYLIFHIGREFFGTKAGFFAATLYAVSPLVIQFSRSSWNPNSVPFFTLLLMYCLYHAVKQNSWKYYLIAGILFGILMQLHYIVVFLGIIMGIFLIVGNTWPTHKQRPQAIAVKLIKNIGITFGGFLIGISPFLAFEIKNNFPNIRTIIGFITGNTVGNDTTGAPFFVIVSEVFPRVFGRLLLALPTTEAIQVIDPILLSIWQVLVLVLAVASIIALVKVKDKLVVMLFLIWVVVGIILFGFYKKPIYDYYFTFLFPAPFLLVGNLFSSVYNYKHFHTTGKVAVVGVFALIVGINLWNNAFRHEPNRQLAQMRAISEFVLTKAEGKPFNFALITDGNSDHAYRFFFNAKGNSPVIIENEMVDPKRATVTDQLLIICETVPCAPLGHPLFEVAAFGRADIVGEWNIELDHGRIYEVPKDQVPFLKVYKLKPYVEEDSNKPINK